MPQVSRITIRGFKSIRPLEAFELTGLNVLIGAHGAGKSNVMTVFRMLGAAVGKNLQRFVREQDGPDALLFRGRKLTKQIALELEFASSETYRVLLEPSASKLVYSREEIVTEIDHVLSSQVLGTGHEEARLADADANEVVLAPYVAASLADWRVYHFNDTTSAAPIRQPQPVEDSIRLKPDGANLAPILRHIRERFPESYSRIVETIQQVAPFFGGFIYRDSPGEKRVALKWFESGDPDTGIARPTRPAPLSTDTSAGLLADEALLALDRGNRQHLGVNVLRCGS